VLLGSNETFAGLAQEVPDGGASWQYRGIAKQKGKTDLNWNSPQNTFWAPELLWHNGVCHMYVSYVRGVPHDWSGERHIVHATSSDLWDWKVESILPLSSNYVIDACVERMPAGQFRMWHKDEANHSHTYAADSPDLFHWTAAGEVIGGASHEGPNVIHWRGAWWMITDHWDGLGVFRSSDGLLWEKQPDNLVAGPGKGPDDQAQGDHCDVVISGRRAFLFYFTHPGRHGAEAHKDSYEQRRSSIQVAELQEKDGWLTCDRDQPTRIFIQPQD